ncbi:MAG: Ig-like domain-containing protein [Dysgonamonadaceae bacterium]|jgi:hypothetical protein|nr:Ig-like domain-containing protein [Dysgonamonadaceae bacterium]
MKNSKLVLMLMLMSMCVWSCKDDNKEVAVQKVTVKPTTVSLELNTTRSVVATVVPSDANQAVEWTSEDETIATVSEGVITAVAVGTTKVIATSIADPSKSATVTVEVTPSTTAVSSIEVSATEADLTVGEERWIEATVLPETALNKDVEWKSGNSAIARVDEVGMIVGVAVGSTTVTVTSLADETKFATVAVRVTPPVLRLLAPADGAEINAQGYVFPISFSWETIDEATSYSLIISNNPAFPAETSLPLVEDIEAGSIELFNAKEFNDLLEANGVAPEATATFYLKVVADNGSESPASSVVITRDKKIVYYFPHSIGWPNVGGYYTLPTEGNVHHWTARLQEAFPPTGYSKVVWAFDYKSEFTVGFFLYARECTSPWWNALMNGGNSYMPPNSQNQWEHWEADITSAALGEWGFGKVDDFLDIQLGEDPLGLAGLYIKDFAFILYE